MVKNKKKASLGKPKQIRFPAEMELAIQHVAEANGIDWVDAVRMAARIGLPVLRRKLAEAVKQAA